MKCPDNCRFCAWTSYFLGDDPAPFSMSLSTVAAQTPRSLTAPSQSTPVASSLSSQCSSSVCSTSASTSGCEAFESDRRVRGVRYLDQNVVRQHQAKEQDTVDRRRYGNLIVWSSFVDLFSFSQILANASLITQAYPLVYVGITTDVCWRWNDCWGYMNMKPHNDTWHMMYVLAMERGSTISIVEEHLVDELHKSYGAKVMNSERYTSGPISKAACNFLYICVVRRGYLF